MNDSDDENRDLPVDASNIDQTDSDDDNSRVLVGIQKAIDEYGFAIINAPEQRTHYSVGLAPNLPEIVVLGGMHTQHINYIMRGVVNLMRSGRFPDPSQPVNIGDGQLLLWGALSEASRIKYTPIACRWLGHQKFMSIQIIVPDPFGLLPGDVRINPDYQVPYLWHESPSADVTRQ